MSEKYVRTLVDNMQYMNKSQVTNEISQFLKQNNSHQARSKMQATGPNVFIFFIELNGPIQLGGTYSEILVGIPRNYPTSAPVFLIMFRQEYHISKNMNNLINSKQISCETDPETNANYFRLTYDFVTSKWRANSRNLTQLYQEVIDRTISINLLQSKNQPQFHQQPTRPQHYGNYGNSHKQLTEIVKSKTTDLQNSQDAYFSVSNKLHELNYYAARSQFLMWYLPKLKQQLSKERGQLESNIREKEDNIQKAKQNRDLWHLIDANPKQQQKLQCIAEEAALKQAERGLQQSIIKQGGRYDDYRKVVRSLYTKMFDNKSQLIKL